MKKHISVFLSFILSISFISCLNAYALTEKIEKSSDAISLIGDSIIFAYGSGSVFYGGEKKNIADISGGILYKGENEEPLIPFDIIESVFSVEASEENGSLKIKGTTVPEGKVCKKENILYLPLLYVAKDILMKKVYEDREMYIISNDEFPYKNSSSSEIIDEEFDVIYRFMQFQRNSAETVYSLMRENLGGNVHPRILTTSDKLIKIKEYIKSDALSKRAYENMVVEADRLCESSEVQGQELSGTSMVETARAIMEKCITLSAAYLLSDGEEKYAERLWLEFQGNDEVEGCFKWADWNIHNEVLGNAELLYGVSVAFDSCYDFWQEKGYINDFLDITYAYSLSSFKKAFEGYGITDGAYFMQVPGNFGFVCNGGIISACLAFCFEGKEEYQPCYDYLLESSMQSIEFPLSVLYPDGAWFEGHQYWEYSIKYLAGSILAPLYFSAGTTFSLADTPGVSSTIESIVYCQNNKYAFNYQKNSFESPVFGESFYILPMISGEEQLMALCKREMGKTEKEPGARTLLWYRPVNEEFSGELARDKYLYSCEVGSMRENWTSVDASCVFFKGGTNLHEAHFDAGTFCFDALGERWASDMGRGSYSVEGGYHNFAGLSLYIRRPEGHNCVVINPRSDIEEKYYGGQAFGENATLEKMESSNREAFSVIDLSNVYSYDTASCKRGYYLGNNRKTLTVQDEIVFKENNSKFYWFMHTGAEILLDSDKKGATLKKNGKTLRIEALSENIDFEFKINRVEKRFETDPVREGQWATYGKSKNLNVLTAEGVGSGSGKFAVRLEPQGDFSSDYDLFDLKPIESWQVSSGQYSHFAKDYENMPISAGESVNIDVNISGEFTDSKIYLGDTLLAGTPEYLGDNIYRFNIQIPENTSSGKVNLRLAVEFVGGNICRDTAPIIVFEYENSQTAEMGFESEILKNGDKITKDAFESSLSSFGEDSGEYTYSAEKLGENSGGKVKFTTVAENKYSSLVKNFSAKSYGAEIKFSWYPKSKTASVGVYCTPNYCYSFEENNHTANIPIFKEGKIFTDSTPLIPEQWYDVKVRVVKVDEGAFKYVVYINDVLYTICDMAHVEGRSERISGLGLLFGGGNEGDVSYIDNIETKLFTPDFEKYDIEEREMEFSDTFGADSQNLKATVSKYGGEAEIKIEGECSFNIKAYIIAGAYSGGVLTDIRISPLLLGANVYKKLYLSAGDNHNIKLMLWDGFPGKPVTKLLSINQ